MASGHPRKDPMRFALPFLLLVACARESGTVAMPKAKETPRTPPSAGAATLQAATFALG